LYLKHTDKVSIRHESWRHRIILFLLLSEISSRHHIHCFYFYLAGIGLKYMYHIGLSKCGSPYLEGKAPYIVTTRTNVKTNVKTNVDVMPVKAHKTTSQLPLLGRLLSLWFVLVY